MNSDVYNDQIANLKGQVGFNRRVIAGLLAVLVLLGYTVYSMIGRERTILVPPMLTKSFWVESGQVSPEYLEEIGPYIAHLELDVTSDVIDFQTRQLLQYAHPSAAPRLKTDMIALKNKLKRDGIATWFSPRTVNVDAKSLVVSIPGFLHTTVGDKKAPDQQKTYLINFKLIHGRLYLMDFKETPNDDPFGLKPTSPAAL